MSWSPGLIERMSRFEQAWILRLTFRRAWSSTEAATAYDWAAGTLPPADPKMGEAEYLGRAGIAFWGSTAPRVQDPADPLPSFYVDHRTLHMPDQRIDLVNYTCTGGQWTIEIEDVADLTRLTPWLAPGQYVELALGYPGATHQDFGRVAMGWLLNATKVGVNRIRILVYEMDRFLNGDRPHSDNCWGCVPVRYSTFSSYTAGDTELTVGPGLGPDFDAYADTSTGGTIYTLTLRPDGGEPFIVRASGRSGDTFTGLAGAEYGTTDVDVASGITDGIQVAYRVSGHPFAVVAQILASTGTGTNGDYDVWPEGLGYGIPSALIAQGDITDWAVTCDTSPAFALDLPIANLGTTEISSRPTTITEGLRELQRTLAMMGVFPVERQGRMTMRALQDLDATPIDSGFHITMAHIVPGSLSVEWYVQERSEDIEGFRVVTSGGGASNPGTDNPCKLAIKRANASLTMDLSGVVWTGGDAPAENIVARTQNWQVERLERVKMVLGGLFWGQLCCGDVVTLTISGFVGPGGEDAYTFARGRLATVEGSADSTQATAHGYNGVKMMVSARRILLPKPAVAIELIRPPRRGNTDDVTPGGQVPLLP